ncbi:MFS transporter [Herbaspirillum sp. RV1423]|uniref:MFS transporter n=1 Tax=Herbaspirillum sp. RV1423 TaxID=1443993 RepID=UPI0004B72E66|nr:MFS transporter [Herbaspirillum sp. RV1423]
MSRPPLLQIVPLAALTGVGMLTTDLYLPALPHLALDLGSDVPAVQATISSFMITLALSQLLWGALADRLGMRNTLLAGIALLAATGVACALASDVNALIIYRAVQGIGAGAATVVVPVLLRRRFADADAMRAISWVSIAESIIPAVAPVIGAGILLVSGWRSNFWLVATLALGLLPFILTLVPGRQVLHTEDETVSYAALLKNRIYLRDATVYGLTFGALVTFVASAPHLIEQWSGYGPGMFALMQVCGVSAFIVAASRAGAMAHRCGIYKLMQSGAAVQLLSVAGLIALGLLDQRHVAPLILCWMLFCAGLGLRGPSTVTRALSVPKSLTSLASGFLMFLALTLSGIGTQLAGFLLHRGLLPVALLVAAMILASLLLQRDGAATQ